MAFIKWMCIVLQKFTKTLNLAAKHKADLLKSLCMSTHLNHAKDMIVADRAGDGFISLGIWCFVCAKRRVSTQSRPSHPHFLPRLTNWTLNGSKQTHKKTSIFIDVFFVIRRYLQPSPNSRLMPHPKARINRHFWITIAVKVFAHNCRIAIWIIALRRWLTIRQVRLV